MRPLTPVDPGTRVVLGISFFVLFVAVWGFATFGGFVSKTFLADPLTMVRSGYTLLTEMGFAKDIGMTVWRVLGGFILAALLALPLLLRGHDTAFNAAHVPLAIVHGWDDELIPARAVIDFAESRRATLHLVNDSHRLADHVDITAQWFGQFLEHVVRRRTNP